MANSRQRDSFRVVVLGDFSGQSSVAAESALSPPRPVNRDNFGDLLQRLNVQLNLTLPGASKPAQFTMRTLDDFHPDQLFASSPLFAQLRLLRSRLIDSATFQQAAGELTSLLEASGVQFRDESPPTEPVPAQDTAEPKAEPGSPSLLDQTLEATCDASLAEVDDLRRFVREIIKPYALPRPNPRQAELVACVDGLTSGLMAAVLHQPQFQDLEAAWRALHFLVRRLETGTDLKLFLLDLPHQQLAADVMSGDDLAATEIYKVLVEHTVETPGGQPWSVVIGNYTFDRTLENIQMLGRMAKIAAAAGAPFISAASPQMVGCESFGTSPDPRSWLIPPEPAVDETWQALRRLPEAAYLGLVLPRFLLRCPYGKQSNPVNSFEFDELSQPFQHDDYVWGNGAFACAYLLAKAFGEDGWQMRPNDHLQIENLPLHMHTVDGDSSVQPCAEAWLTDRAAHAISAQGIMPLLSIKDRDMIRLGQFQSVTDPAAGLAGVWNLGQ